MSERITAGQFEDLKDLKNELLKEFLEGQPPEYNGERLIGLWEKLYDEDFRKTVVQTVSGPSDDGKNPVMPYEKIQAILGDGGNWKVPRLWQRFDEIERRGVAYREGEELNFAPNKNPDITPQRVLVVGGGPVGLRTAIELVMGGHEVTLMEKRREIKNEDGTFKQLGFTNRINRPHMWPFVRNDLAKLSGKELLSQKAAYPVFTEPDTMSIGIDELQCLLIKNALMLGVEIQLGCGYVNAKIVDEDEDGNLAPSWNVEYSVDAGALEAYGCKASADGKYYRPFDCLVGCDGPRTAVRETQKKYFGDVEKRKFMDCVGIVANVQKVSKKRLKDLGFADGLEPNDMNKTKMVFKEFFQKLQDEAQADIENLIFYKASFHNYTILVPKRADMIKHGLSGKVYSFHDGRSGAGNKAMEEEKLKLKNYCKNVLVAAGIPIDPELPNDGFVGVPNDCMAFDFAECWNTKKSLHFSLPPPGTAPDEWEGKRLVPFVALAGDALLEPFWPMGLGLKRGWQAIMDTVWAIDNLYNRRQFFKFDEASARTKLKEKGVDDVDDEEWAKKFAEAKQLFIKYDEAKRKSEDEEEDEELARPWLTKGDLEEAEKNDPLITKLAEIMQEQDDDYSWETHYDNLLEQTASNFEYCNRLMVSTELAKGEYDDKSDVIKHIKKYDKDMEKPTMYVEIDPWTRYEPLEKKRLAEFKKEFESMSRADQQAYMHPVAKKALAMKEYYIKNADKKGDIEYKGKALITINGKSPPGAAKAKAEGDKPKKKPGAAPKSRRGKA